MNRTDTQREVRTMDATEAVELVHVAANAYSLVGYDGCSKGRVRQWVAADERRFTKKLLTALIGRTPTKQEIEDGLSD